MGPLIVVGVIAEHFMVVKLIVALNKQGFYGKRAIFKYFIYFFRLAHMYEHKLLVAFFKFGDPFHNIFERDIAVFDHHLFKIGKHFARRIGFFALPSHISGNILNRIDSRNVFYFISFSHNSANRIFTRSALTVYNYYAFFHFSSPSLLFVSAKSLASAIFSLLFFSPAL